MTNIFIGIAQGQVDNFQNLIRQLEVQNEHNVLVTSKSIKYDVKIFQKVITSGETFNNNTKNKIEKLKSIVFKIKHYKSIIKALKPYQEEEKITLYFCYIEDVLTNHLFFFFNKNIKGIVVEDGVLNYYNHTFKNISNLTFFFKRVISFLFGVKIKKYKGHSSGIDYEKTNCQYVRVPSLSIAPHKSKLLQVTQLNIGSFTDSILFIGQEPLEGVIGEEEYYKRISFILDKIKSYSNIEKVYYKPHRNGKRLNRKFLESNIKDSKIIYLDDNTSIEDLYLSSLRSKYIFGFNTSAAINIYMSLCENDRRKIHLNVFLEKEDTLKGVFTQLKFNILHL